MKLVRIENRGYCFGDMQRQTGDICYIVIHHSAGATNADAVHAAHKVKSWAGIGYHYFIEPDTNEKCPLVVQGRPLEYIGAHVYGHNAGTVGICLGGDYSQKQPSPDMIFSTALLAAELCRELDIDPIVGIVGHNDLASTTCPGIVADFLPLIRETAADVLGDPCIEALRKLDYAEEIEAYIAVVKNPFLQLRCFRELAYLKMGRGG